MISNFRYPAGATPTVMRHDPADGLWRRPAGRGPNNRFQ